MLKGFGFLGTVAIGGLAFSTMVGGSYSREVDRPMPEVMAALADLDIREQPGQPGTDPSRSGGIMPLFLLERTADTMTWKVMSGDKVATSMTVFLEPIDGGARTLVTTDVERGDAPDDFVSPAFRSEGLTFSLFSMAVEAELNELTLPSGDPAKCRELIERFESGAFASADPRPRDLSGAMGQTAGTAIKLHAVEAEMRRNGCDTSGPAGEFTPITTQMTRGPDPFASGTLSETDVSFEAGKPMVNVRN